MPLTDNAIKALKPKDKRYKVFDGQGLHLEVQPSGTKVWRVKYRFGGKEKRATIGHYPLISLREARAALAEVLKKLSAGIDQYAGHQKNLPTRLTFQAVAEDWIEKQTPRWSVGHLETVKMRLEAYIFPHLGKAPVSEIAPTDVLRLVRVIEARGKLETASRILGICSQVFRYGVSCGVCPSDPCRDLRGALTAHVETPRAALADPAEVAGLMASIREYNGSSVVRNAMLWSAYTFCRPGEVRRAEWSEIEWEKKEWRIPAAKMKMRLEHRVPLAGQCMEILSEMHAMKLSEVWIFPGPRPSRPLSENGVLSALRRMGYEKHEMTAHGFRAMASTLLNEMGYRPDIIERQLAHGDTDKIRAVYNRAAYMDERRVMMQKWADYLDGLTVQKQNRPGASGILV
jgi:integrase